MFFLDLLIHHHLLKLESLASRVNLPRSIHGRKFWVAANSFAQVVSTLWAPWHSGRTVSALLAHHLVCILAWDKRFKRTHTGSILPSQQTADRPCCFSYGFVTFCYHPSQQKCQSAWALKKNNLSCFAVFLCFFLGQLSSTRCHFGSLGWDHLLQWHSLSGAFGYCTPRDPPGDRRVYRLGDAGDWGPGDRVTGWVTR